MAEFRVRLLWSQRLVTLNDITLSGTYLDFSLSALHLSEEAQALLGLTTDSVLI